MVSAGGDFKMLEIHESGEKQKAVNFWFKLAMQLLSKEEVFYK